MYHDIYDQESIHSSTPRGHNRSRSPADRHADLIPDTPLGIQALLTRGEAVLKDDRTQSYCIRLPLLLSRELLTTWKDALLGLEWMRPHTKAGHPIPRQTLWVANCGCSYEYGGMQIPPQPFTDLLQEITTLVFDKLNMPLPNCCNLNLYSHGSQQVGWHDDSEDLFKDDDVRIISLSLGATRTFEIVSKERMGKTQNRFRFAAHKGGFKSADPADIIQMELAHGDVVVMAGNMQTYYEHRLPPNTTLHPRINLTWRYITRHTPGCHKHTC